jgi:hypothetical protein
LHTVGGDLKCDGAVVENSCGMEDSQKIKTTTTYDIATPLLGV